MIENRPTRKGTVDECVSWLEANNQSWAHGYRKDCIKHWRERYGDIYADAIVTMAKQKGIKT